MELLPSEKFQLTLKEWRTNHLMARIMCGIQVAVFVFQESQVEFGVIAIRQWWLHEYECEFPQQLVFKYALLLDECEFRHALQCQQPPGQQLLQHEQSRELQLLPERLHGRDLHVQPQQQWRSRQPLPWWHGQSLHVRLLLWSSLQLWSESPAPPQLPRSGYERQLKQLQPLPHGPHALRLEHPHAPHERELPIRLLFLGLLPRPEFLEQNDILV
mmetsp:Transcript_19696/g.14436  ORF Transcript_19696/g.14436 Transcript_19696/m.14436 type:complete len:215 (-) Transcript_19696:1957-2601(-)